MKRYIYVRFELDESISIDLFSQYLNTMHVPYEIEEEGLLVYEPKFGDDKLCKCGHPYYRHFDTYDHMTYVGCKYCNHEECKGWEEKNK